MNNEKLKPCPFCGSEELNFRGAYMGLGEYIECSACNMGSKALEGREGLIKYWNTRNGEKQLAEKILREIRDMYILRATATPMIYASSVFEIFNSYGVKNGK